MPPSDEKRLSKWAGPLQTFLEFLAKGGADEVKKLPGGSFLVTGAEMLAARLGKRVEKQSGDADRADGSAAERKQEELANLIEFARVLILQQQRVLELAGKAGVGTSAEALTEAAKQTALVAFRAGVARTCRDVDRRPIGPMELQEHITLLPLDDIYVVPDLVVDAGRIGEREIEQKWSQELDEEGGYLPEPARRHLESEQAARRVRRWRRGLDTGRRPLGEALSSARRMVLLGLPGTGKTTLLHYIAHACALGEESMRARFGWGEDTTPILAPLAAFARARSDERRLDLSLRGFLDREMRERGGEPLKLVLDEEIAAGRVFVLFDGVDEVPDENDRADVAKAIERFLEDHPHIRCLVTSRPAGYQTVRGGLPHLSLPNFTPEQVADFVRRWRRALERRANPDDPNLKAADASAEALLTEIRANPQIEELATNPLLLVILTLLHVKGTRLPERRVELYRRVVEMLAGQWNRLRARQQGVSLEPGLNEDELIEVLAAVAAWTRREKPRGIVHRDELQHQMAGIIESRFALRRGEAERAACSYLDAAANKAGLLTNYGYDYFMFWHSTFEEYLTARELANPASEAKNKLLALRNDPRYREVILLAVAHIGKRERSTATELVRALWQEDTGPLEPILHTNLVLAADCVVDRAGIRPDREREILLALAETLKDQPFEPLIQAFARLTRAVPRIAENAPEVVTSLAPLADHKRWEVRREVGRLFASAAPVNLEARTLCEHLLKDKDAYVRCHAALGLARVGDDLPEVWLALLNYANSLAYLRGDAVEFFEANAERTGRVVASLLQSGNASLRPEAASLLVRAGHAVIPVLLELLRNEKAYLRLRAASLLVRLERVDETVPVLLELLQSKDGDLRYEMVSLLVQVGRVDEAVPVLLELLRNEKAYLRLRAASLLVRLERVDETVPVLLGLLQSGSLHLRSESVSLLVQAGRVNEAVPMLVELLRNEDGYLRFEAVSLLVQAGHVDEAVPALVELLRNENAHLRSEAALQLVRAGHVDAVVPMLVKWLQNSNGYLRFEAVSLLVQAGHVDEAVPDLVKWLQSEKVSVRLVSLLIQVGRSSLRAREALISVALAGDAAPVVDAFEAVREGSQPQSEAEAALLHDLLRLQESDGEQERTAKGGLFDLLWEAYRQGERADDD